MTTPLGPVDDRYAALSRRSLGNDKMTANGKRQTANGKRQVVEEGNITKFTAQKPLFAEDRIWPTPGSDQAHTAFIKIAAPLMGRNVTLGVRAAGEGVAGFHSFAAPNHRNQGGSGAINPCHT